MPRPPQKNTEHARSPLLRRSEQFALAVLLLSGIVSLGGYWAWRGVVGGRLIDIDRAQPRSAQFQVDINAAGWAELSQLPGVGETMARRIVAERTANGPFAEHAELSRRVHGIGPRTLERIRPYLLPMPESRNIAGGKSAPTVPGGS